MERAPAHPLPSHDPVTGGEMIVTEIEGLDTGITIRGRFEMPRFARLSPDQARYLETFLRCRGMLNSVERELGISYPTARARLDAVLRALDLHAVREESLPANPAEPEPEMGGFEETFLDGGEPLLEEPALFEPEPLEHHEEASDSHMETPAEPHPIFEEAPPEETPKPSRLDVLGMLERGEITPEQAKNLMGVGK